MPKPANDQSETKPHRIAIVLSGGGSRGAYEAGVLAYLFEEIYPQLGENFEFDIVSGTSVGAIHAAYLAASHGLPATVRSQNLVDTWASMTFDTVMDVKWRHLLGIPLRAAGMWQMRRDTDESGRVDTFGGLVDIAPLEKLVNERIPWARLPANLAGGKPGAVCVAATEVTTGMVRLFIDGSEANTLPWDFDPQVNAVKVDLRDHHVRASAAIPFLFPAVRVDDCFYVDGGIRLNTPLSPVIRMRADRVLVIGVKHQPSPEAAPATACQVDSIAKPAFLLGKLLDAVLLDPIEHELRQLEIINALIEGGEAAYGPDFGERMAPFVRAKRGVGYRPVRTQIINPSEDLGAIAAACHRESRAADSGWLASLITGTASAGTPDDEADFLSYVYFDRSYTQRLIDLGRRDAAANHDAIFALLTN